MRLVRSLWFRNEYLKSPGIQLVDTCDRSSNHMATCVSPNCNLIAHSCVPSTNGQLVFKIPQLAGLSCFEVAPHELSMGLFSLTSKNSCTVDT